jgi:probable phosphoglycerate mutase
MAVPASEAHVAVSGASRGVTASGLPPRSEVWIVRHGETEWSTTGRHTSRTDVPLTEAGRREARVIGSRLEDIAFARVRCSPMSRATETAKLAGLGDRARPTDDLREWEYGAYEGLTTRQIRETVAGWTIWPAGAPGGETPEQVGRRVDRVIAEARALPGRTLLIAHAHILRVLTARWLGLAASEGRLFVLGTGTISVLGWEREQAAILRWNERCEAGPPAGEPAQRTTRTEQGAS